MGKQPVDIDEILNRCGSFGRFQYMLLGCFCLINVLSSMHYYSQTIISFVPQHWCYSNKTKNMSMSELREFYSTFANPSCTNIDGRGGVSSSYVNSTSNQLNKKKHDGSTDVREILLHDSEIDWGVCEKWIYDYDFLHGYRSMTSDLNWVCQNSHKSITGQAFYFVGSVIGTFVMGIFADIIGRLPILIIAHMFGIFGNALTIFATNSIAFAFCRFISGMATDNNFVMMYILVLEYIPPDMRTIGLNLCIGVFYCIGSMVSPWLAVWLGNWKLYLLATIIPALIVPLFYFLIPESAEWLISQNRLNEALACYRRIAKTNRKALDEDFVKDFNTVSVQINTKREKNMKNPSIIALFKTPRLRRLMLILFLKSMIITLCYDAISKHVEGLGMSPFILFSISASAILPACLLLIALQDRIGRKAMASSSLLLSGIFTSACGVILAYQSSQDAVTLGLLSVIGRFGVTIAYNSGAQYATELIPTCVRAQGVATAHVAGYAFTFFSSYILYTGTFFKAMPSLILGTLSFVGALCCLFLPETLNRKTPITLEDGEEFGRGERFFHFACCDGNIKQQQKPELMVTTMVVS